MSQNPVVIGEIYYTRFKEKDIQGMENYLHPDVQFSGPLAKENGKAAVVQATTNFMAFFQSLQILAKFGSEDQAAIVYEVECPAPIGKCRTVSWLTFKDGLITKIELFYDARPFERKRNEIFSQELK